MTLGEIRACCVFPGLLQRQAPGYYWHNCCPSGIPMKNKCQSKKELKSESRADNQPTNPKPRQESAEKSGCQGGVCAVEWKPGRSAA
jgi:hypothetical protein